MRLNPAVLAAILACPAHADLGDQLFKLLPSDGAAGKGFGVSVAISGTTAIVGAVGDDDNGSLSGSAYLLDTTTGQQIAKLLPDDGAPGDRFGFSVAISGDTAIVGALADDDNGDASGSAYLFDADICPADIDGDGDLDAEDFFAYLELFASGDDRADIDGDGDIDAEDFFGYLDLFVQGC